jgi:hypothetical protein
LGGRVSFVGACPLMLIPTITSPYHQRHASHHHTHPHLHTHTQHIYNTPPPTTTPAATNTHTHTTPTTPSHQSAMSHFVRSSKYRHVFVDAPKTTDTYSAIRLSTAVGEQNYIKANPKYFAVALSVSVCMCVCVRVCMCVCICVCVYSCTDACSDL